MQLNFDDRFNKELPADPLTDNQRRQVREAAYSFVTPRVPGNPQLLHASPEVASLVGINQADLDTEDFLKMFSGATVHPETHPYAMCYGGHQFGNWAGQLGDGRAINLGEVQHAGKHWTLQLKGAGATPYSRTADGLAVLRSSLREHLCSEAMFHLGVPTSRSLCLIQTGDQVMRDMLYDGRAAYEPGAVVCRVAPSFIRFGSFEIFASRGELDLLKQLTSYTIKHFFPGIASDTKQGIVEFFRTVSQRTLEMVVHWQRVGFVHGVMNTDNMSIHGETIDYGPYGWLEGYDYDWTPNTTDAGRKRYRFGNQPSVALWNLVKLASALHALTEESEPLEEVLEEFQSDFKRLHNEMLAAKIGLEQFNPDDESLVDDLTEVLQLTETDMTLFFRLLSNVNKSEELTDSTLMDPVLEAFYQHDELAGEVREQWSNWFDRYLARLNQDSSSDAERKGRMNRVNPKYVLRNYMAQLAIDKATDGDLSLIVELYELLKQPYEEQPDFEKWFAKRPEWARHKVGCSMLSCSS